MILELMKHSAELQNPFELLLYLLDIQPCCCSTAIELISCIILEVFVIFSSINLNISSDFLAVSAAVLIFLFESSINNVIFFTEL